MLDTSQFLHTTKQHQQLAIRVTSPGNKDLPDELVEQFLRPHRKTHYFSCLILKGRSRQMVDMEEISFSAGQLLFILPHQIHHWHRGSVEEGMEDYFKISFDQACLSLLPKSFGYFLNPFNRQVITFDADAMERVKSVFGLLQGLLKDKATPATLILAHLNTLLTEFDQAYFREGDLEHNGPERLGVYIQFKLLVERELTSHLSVKDVAGQLSVNTNLLYQVVKQYSGLSPKEFITQRLILEARRKLFYSETTVKALAFELGFNDPDYFSRTFKKHTGQSVADFLLTLQALAG
jgi:AraC family transcriptional activator of pobA